MSIPNIAINGATTRLERRADSFVVSVHAGLPNALCVPPEWRKLSFEWSQELGPSFSLDPTIRQSKDLYISRNTLEAYYTYAFTVTSWLTVEPASRCVPASHYHPPIFVIAFLSPGLATSFLVEATTLLGADRLCSPTPIANRTDPRTPLLFPTGITLLWK